MTHASARRQLPDRATRVFVRWSAVAAVMSGFLVLYTQHPYYRGAQFQPWRFLYLSLFVGWIVLGYFYVDASLRTFTARRYQMRDVGLHLLVVGRALWEGRFWDVVKNRRIKTTVLGIVVKAFFTPLMAGFMVQHLNNISSLWLRLRNLPPLKISVANNLNVLADASQWWAQVKPRVADFVPTATNVLSLTRWDSWERPQVWVALDLVYNLIFLVDVGWALFGYATESRWLGNKTRSVEPTALGWIVCLFCYPPFNPVTGTYLPLADGPVVIHHDTTKLVLKALIVLLFAVYASATVSFGFKFSNLTNRGIVSRGPYAYVRHPAYLCKCSAWWLEHLPTMTLTKAFFLTLLCGLYGLRAWTEERHLSMDPEYVAYKKRVPWVVFPGVY